MHAWEQIQQTIEYIEEHLNEDISIDALAKLAALSPFYYQRLFSRLVKKPVAEYIRLRRMARATEALLDKDKRDKRILDIALELGFSSHQHFTRTFKETFGLTPEEYRSAPRALNCMTKPELLLHYVLIDEGVPLITNGIVLEMNRRRLAQPLRFAGVEHKTPVSLIAGLGVESGPDPLDALWRTFHYKKTAEFGLNDDAEEIGVAYPCAEEGFFNYFAGAVAGAALPEGCVSWELPAGEYAVCTFEAEDFQALVMDALYKAEQYVYDVWLPNHKLAAQPFCAERYSSHSPQTTTMEVWLKLA